MKSTGSVCPFKGVTLCFIYVSEFTQIWLFLPLYGSHKCDQYVEKNPCILLEKYLLNNSPYDSGVSKIIMFMNW